MITNKNSFILNLNREKVRLDKKMRRTMTVLMSEGMRRLIRRTPVNTGSAVMSYIASVGSPATGYSQGFEVTQATNKLPLGSEENRGAASAVAMATLKGIGYGDPYRTYWISNNAPNISGLEAGELPKLPYKPRSPAGMFGITLQELSALLEGGRI